MSPSKPHVLLMRSHSLELHIKHFNYEINQSFVFGFRVTAASNVGEKCHRIATGGNTSRGGMTQGLHVTLKKKKKDI